MKELFADHYFSIGKAHLNNGQPCQDYAISSVQDGAAIAVVSDGCSTGGHTDVGARVLALSTQSAICDHWALHKNTLEELASRSISLAQKVVVAHTCQTLGLAYEDMLATCEYAYISPTGGYIHIQGDGVVAMKFGNGGIFMHRYEWDGNMPFYPAYSQFGMLARFVEAHGGDRQAPLFTEEIWYAYEEEGKYRDIGRTEHTLAEGVRGITIAVDQDCLDDDLEFVAVFSDGVTQIEGIDWKDAVRSLVGFKGLKGNFAKRRMIREIRDAAKAGKAPMDDISYAVIRIAPEVKKEG